MAEANWYVVHTYSGYENKVKANIDKTIENRHLEDEILEVRVPMQDVVELKNGAKKQVQKKMFPWLCSDSHDHERRYLVCGQKYQRCHRIRWWDQNRYRSRMLR